MPAWCLREGRWTWRCADRRGAELARTIARRVQREGLINVLTVLGSDEDPRLPQGRAARACCGGAAEGAFPGVERCAAETA